LDFALSDDQIAFRDTARAFAVGEMEPHAAEWDRTSFFPRKTLERAAALGFGALYCDPAHGGTGLGRLDAALVFEELARGCTSTAAFLSIHNMASWMIDRYGQPALRAELGPDLASMARVASYCLTEPGSGSDAASLKTRAVRDGGDYLLTGTKAFISGGGAADVYVVMARTGADGSRGISTFVVEAGAAGLSFGAQERKLGWKSQPTAMVILEQVRVPASHRLGAEGEGFRIAMSGLDGGRINIAACSLGGASFALDRTLSYVKERQQFGQALSEFQALRFRLADMATDLEAARLMVHRAADALDRRDPAATRLAAMAKRFATDACFTIVNECLQLHGGYGYLQDYPIERILRDVRVHQILEGTNEIMRMIIARDLIGA
jgi:alkylation response protein AidB-like acyl-CoA dehydrogenase